MENALSNLEFGGWKSLGGKCYLEPLICGVENLGWKMLYRISNLGVENLGWKMLSRIYNLGGRGWKIWGG